MKYLLIIFLFASCVTQKKAERWMNEHETEAAGYCSTKFPAQEKTVTVTKEADTAKFLEAYDNLEHTLDSALSELRRKAESATPENPYRPNIDSIRKVLISDLRRGLKPCKDSTITIIKTVVDRARERYLQGLIDQKDKTITDLQRQNAGLQDKLVGARKWAWYFWILIGAIGIYTFLRIKYKLKI